MNITDQSILSDWQNLVDILTRIFHVPSAIITKFDPPYVEIFKASTTPENPYSEGLRVEMAGHYCEAVFKNKQKLLVTNALEDNQWQQAPEIDYGMIFYFGLPVRYPDGELFGTLCVLDSKENIHSIDLENLLIEFRNMLESHLTLLLQKQELEMKNEEIRTLKGIIPICAQCKNIRNDEGYWEQVESYIQKHSHADFSHSICPECFRSLYPEISARIAGKTFSKP